MEISKRIAFGVLIAGPVAAQAVYLGPSSYLSAADSPFTGSFAYSHLENFEDGVLNTPGVAASGGVAIAPSSSTDSVDGDDGAIDGSGVRGRSWYSSAGERSFRFAFSAGVLGAYPTHAGIVWTDVGFTDGTFSVGAVEFEAWDASNTSLGVYGPFTLGDGAFTGQTAEDRFFGAVHAGGISAIEIRMPGSGDWEVDHLQYAAVPEPASMLALGAAVSALAVRRRARRPQP